MKSAAWKPMICVVAGACALTISAPAFAGGWPVYDALVHLAVNAVNTSINTMSQSLSQLLQNIGSAINENGNKIAHTVEAAARAEREFKVAQEKNRRIEDARQRYAVPSSICSESGSGGAMQVASVASAVRGNIRPGGDGPIANAAIEQAVNSPPPAPEVDAARAAKIHAQFCDADDFKAYGGSRACPAVSATMPGADKRVSSILTGAGPNGKAPDLTFSQTQTDVARMYAQNAIRRSIGPQLRKGEADTVAGAQYVGLMNQYNAIVSAAADPQETQIADSQPNAATRDLIREALHSPSAAAYYKQAASPEARRTGAMSYREFEAFEVGRRYANTEYQADLQAMSGDNLLREQIRVATLNNWLLLGVKDELVRGNIVNGQILGSSARQEFEPLLAQKYRAVAGRMGGQ
jgi:hypothetical protein